MTDSSLDFTLPIHIRDFIFDLHESTRGSMRSEDVTILYETKFKELTEKFFAQSPWPSTHVVAPECNHDESFLLFYKLVFFV